VYDTIGSGYANVRRADPRIAMQIRAAVGPVGRVVDVGAGAGSYEPGDLPVIAVEPSVTMLAQRPRSAAPAVRAVAEGLPFASGCFEAGMAILTVHHWTDPADGLRELRRVVRGAVVVLTWDARAFNNYWMVTEYLPASATLDDDLPSPEEIAEVLGGGTVEPVLVPADCSDGFYAAWWRRPEAYLDRAVRAGISGLARLDEGIVQRAIEQLERDLLSGEWHRRHSDLLDRETYDAGYRLVISPRGRA
jgi:SAM-dependent methyltransferase